MNDELRDRLGASLSTLVSAVGTALVRADEITVVPDAGMRRTYRLWFEDGHTLKGRRFRTPVRAEIVWRVLTRMDAPYLARAISHEGDAMLEEWVDGEALVQGQVDHRVVRDAGRLLGTLHGRPPPPTEDIDFQPVDGRGWARKTVESLRTLHDRGLIAAGPAGVLKDLVMSHLPATVPIGVVHRDLCPENLVVDASGRLISVDNGSVTLGAIDYDLCRVWYRWPMSSDEQAAFNAGYREHREADALGHPPLFWAIVVIVNSARTRLGVSSAAASAALERLDAYFSEQSFDWRAGGRVRAST